MKTGYYVCSLLVWIGLIGCSVPSQSEAFKDVEHHVNKKVDGRMVWLKNSSDRNTIDESIDLMLAKPLNGDDVVRITMLNNPSLQSLYGEIGLAQGDLIQAGLPQNPFFSYSIGHGNNGLNTKIGLEFSFLDIVFIPLRKKLEEIRFEEVKIKVANEVLKVSLEARKGYFEYIAAQKIKKLARESFDNIEIQAKLAARQYGAGNLTIREQKRFEVRYAQARQELNQAEKDVVFSREKLIRLMGLYGKRIIFDVKDENLILDETFHTFDSLEEKAIANRLDIQSARLSLKYALRLAGVTDYARYFDAFDIGGEIEKKSQEKGFYTLQGAISVPLFDQGQGRITKAQALVLQNQQKLIETAINARSEVREIMAVVSHNYDIAHHSHKSIVPLKREILKETQKYYNGMLDGVYELLDDQHELTEAIKNDVIAWREFWVSRSQLAYVMGDKQ